MKFRSAIIFFLLSASVLLLSGCACEHSYGDWSVSEKSTCIYEGSEVRACLSCGEEEMRKLPLAAHEYGAWSISIPASCTKGGTETRVCALCAATEDRGTELVPHSFGKAKTITSATCKKTGLAEHSCGSCGYTEKITTDQAPHTWIAATCLKPKTCKICAKTSGTPCQMQFFAIRQDTKPPIEVNESTLKVIDDGDGTITLTMEFEYLSDFRTNLCRMTYYDNNDQYLGSSIGRFMYLDYDNNYCSFQHSGIPADTVKMSLVFFAY